MLREEALGKLGLENDASTETIKEAIASRRTKLQAALAKAPTDALKAKYEGEIQQLREVEQVLSSSSSSSSSSSARASASGLSQTKLADLPQSATHFDDGPTAQINLRAGQTLAGRYEIREQIGAGGMGAVYRALDNTTGKEIALKVLLPALMKNGRARERFLDEARISQQLSHPNIVNVYDVQQDGDFFFLTMELLEGQDLRQVMDNRKLARQPFDRQEVLEILDPLCEALAYAHQYTVHRDIKPENIWIGEDGTLKVMDFGIARAQSTSQRTQTGAAMGTAYYMAPEQLKGQKEIDGRADMYSVAVMAYELLSGEVPAGMIQPLQKQRKGIPRKLADVIHQGLASRPDGRLADIQAFRAALQKAAQGGFELNLPWKGIGIAAALLVAVLGVGSLAASGSFSLDGLKGLLPMSKEEIAAHRASLAKIQGEIKVLKQRLESSRRSLDSDVRDAERNQDNNLEALRHWQRLTEDALFSGSRITELEGDLSMAEALLRDDAFEQARPAFERVRDGYADLHEQFASAAEIYEARQKFALGQSEWEELKENYALNEPALIAGALELEREARQQERQGDYTAALENWQWGTGQWRAAHASVREKVAKIDSDRKAAAQRRAAEARQKAERAAAAAAMAKAKQNKVQAEKIINELVRLIKPIQSTFTGRVMMGPKMGQPTKTTVTSLGAPENIKISTDISQGNQLSCSVEFDQLIEKHVSSTNERTFQYRRSLIDFSASGGFERAAGVSKGYRYLGNWVYPHVGFMAGGAFKHAKETPWVRSKASLSSEASRFSDQNNIMDFRFKTDEDAERFHNKLLAVRKLCYSS